MTGTVLILDDSLTVRMDLAEAFERASFITLPCATLAEARSALAREPVVLAVLDVLLPDGDGTELLREIRALPSGASIPVLMLSSEAEVQSRIRGLTIGADDYVGKPYDTGYVVARACELLRRHQHTDESESPKVLVIDDSATFREGMRDALEGAGYSVLAAASGEAGLRMAADSRPAAVIVDGVMTGMDGAAVIRSIRLDAALRRIPCVLLTGSEGAKSELDALDAGADAFVRKEEDLSVILARLAAVLRNVDPLPDERTSLLGPKRILAVDDSPTYLNGLSEALRSEGYDVVLARSGEEAIEMLAVQTVDCILMDLLMPGMGGKEACRRIKATQAARDVPLIILTALEDRESMIDGLGTGADDYVAKSSEFDLIRARVRAQLRRKQFEDENRHIREQLLRRELEAAEARSARELAETRAALLADLERKNRELEHAKEIAERESGFKTKFLANMSHELRTPLNAIIGFSELLEDGIAGQLLPTQHQYIGHVLNSGRHLLNIINDILDLSKIEAGKMDLRVEWTSLSAIVESASHVVGPLAQKRGVTLEVSMADDLPSVHVDPIRIRQVLYNLLSNGIKFTAEGGTVRLLVRHEGRHVSLTVEDTGIGIRAEDLGRLFREFEQIEPSGDKPEGTGLGLVLTRRLVEMHGGSVSAESEIGKGSRFRVVLPVAQPGDSNGGSDQGGAGAGESLVLVVEDDPKAAELIASVLRAAGLAVVFAGSSGEAIRKAEELKPAAITLDILMPGVDGWATLSLLKSSPTTASIPVVVISVVDDPTRALLLGANDYLVKPVSRDALLGSIEAAGLPVQRIDGLRVLLVGNGSAALQEVESHLRSAGCEIEHAPELTPAALGATSQVDIVLVDFTSEPGHVTARLDDLLRSQAFSTSIVGIVDPDGQAPGLRADLKTLATTDAIQRDRLVRAVGDAVDKGRLGKDFWHLPTGLPSAQALHGRLTGLLRRAEREKQRLAVVVATVPLPKEPKTPWLRLLQPHLRSTDYVAIAGDSTVAFVVYGASEDAARTLADRFARSLRTAVGVDVDDLRIVWYPEDGRGAEDLLARALPPPAAKALP